MRRVKSLVVVLLALILVSCAALQSIGIMVKPYSEMSPKEKMALIYKTYNKQYEDYKVQASKTNLSENERVVLRMRKDILIKVYPVIQGLDLALVEGKPFDPANEKLVIDYLRQLGAKIE
jgi:hypothetical protein